MGILSFLVALPLIGAIVLLFLPEAQARTAKIVAMSFASATFVASLIGVAMQFDSNTFHFQLMERYKWFPELNIQYSLGVDGISIWLVMLTTLMSVVAVAASLYVDRRVKLFMAMLLSLESFMLGSFLSLDLILFFTFFELTLFPMWALINIWGGERRVYAGNKFFIYTFAGSIFMLVGIVALANQMPHGTNFDIVAIQWSVANGSFWTNAIQLEGLIFWSFAIALLIKAPSFPFHTWMPTAYSEAPSVVPILSSVMVKMGTYGLLRFCLPLFPDVLPKAVPVLMALAVIGIIYGAVVAAIQPDMRRLIAYSSVSHMGFILLGIFSVTQTGLTGGAYQQINHGVITGAMILLLGFLYERRPSKLLSDFGGLKAQMPIFAALFLVVMLASVGLPGTNGFVGEFLAMLGTFEASYARLHGLNIGFAIAAGFGVVLAAVYLLYMFQQMFYGKVSRPENRLLRDLKACEIAVAAVLVVFILWGGLYPSTFLKPMEASLQATRMMALNPVGQRPIWGDNTLEIDMAGHQPDRGALVRLDGKGGNVLGVVAPSDTHPTPPPQVPATAEASRLPEVNRS